MDRRVYVNGTFRIQGLVLIAVAISTAASCAGLGFSNRVLHNVPSPDGSLVAVCQEIPAYDGPDFELRLERQGQVLRTLLTLGDGDPCHEVVWSPDGRLLVVLSSQVARAVVLDVRGTLAKPANEPAIFRTVGFEGTGTLARNLRFVEGNTVEYEACPFAIGSGSSERVCSGPVSQRRRVL